MQGAEAAPRCGAGRGPRSGPGGAVTPGVIEPGILKSWERPWEGKQAPESRGAHPGGTQEATSTSRGHRMSGKHWRVVAGRGGGLGGHYW